MKINENNHVILTDVDSDKILIYRLGQIQHFIETKASEIEEGTKGVKDIQLYNPEDKRNTPDKIKELMIGMIYDYLKWGGFPLRFEFGDEANTMRYIKGLYDSIVTRDIVPKNSRIDKAVFKAISLYILANAGKEFSGENIAAYYNKNSEKNVSARTIYNYLDKMKKAFLLHSVGQYHLSGRASLKGREKYYATG